MLFHAVGMAISKDHFLMNKIVKQVNIIVGINTLAPSINQSKKHSDINMTSWLV